MREFCLYGSVRGALSNERPYREPCHPRKMIHSHLLAQPAQRDHLATLPVASTLGSSPEFHSIFPGSIEMPAWFRELAIALRACSDAIRMAASASAIDQLTMLRTA